MITIKPAGQPIAKIEKFAGESIVYLLDCTSLLEDHELITSICDMEVPEGVTLTGVRSRLGKRIELCVSNSPLTTQQYLDFTVPIPFKTTTGSKKLAVFQIRTYK